MFFESLFACANVIEKEIDVVDFEFSATLSQLCHLKSIFVKSPYLICQEFLRPDKKIIIPIQHFKEDKKETLYAEIIKILSTRLESIKVLQTYQNHFYNLIMICYCNNTRLDINQLQSYSIEGDPKIFIPHLEIIEDFNTIQLIPIHIRKCADLDDVFVTGKMIIDKAFGINSFQNKFSFIQKDNHDLCTSR